MAALKFMDCHESLYETSDHPVIMQLLRCGVRPVKAERGGKRISVFFKEKDALSMIAKVALEENTQVSIADVSKADVTWKSILDALKE